jgi:hypothetical protein
VTAAAPPDVLAEFYDAMGYAVRELEKAHDALTAIVAGLELEAIPGAILDATSRVDHVYAMAADFRRRFA